jgi:hypothetical protein
VVQEREFLAPFLESAAAGGVLVVGQIKAALDKRLGRKVALASAYNLLHRHNWRRARSRQARSRQAPPPKRPGRSDGVEKNSPRSLPKSAKTGRKTNPSN